MSHLNFPGLLLHAQATYLPKSWPIPQISLITLKHKQIWLVCWYWRRKTNCRSGNDVYDWESSFWKFLKRRGYAIKPVSTTKDETIIDEIALEEAFADQPRQSADLFGNRLLLHDVDFQVKSNADD